VKTKVRERGRGGSTGEAELPAVHAIQVAKKNRVMKKNEERRMTVWMYPVEKGFEIDKRKQNKI